ncbi:transmembrane protein C1orf162 homolog [Trichosurus vulpecula]|uniref:transmembrane protein C1orf162 homolog n=1 Tax=Trichosurus vulpecula TaxID=9337 RepID=UPI00186B20E3|nr:transmembrane protein C1orf162 homolog [Trichosurus vulpecula]XP_036623983.1 transmembrane protein C1orf162 homolog [Trichosurus vulpecula]
MGSFSSKPTEEPDSSTPTTEATHIGESDGPAIFYKIYPYLLMAFVAGVLLTLLVVCLIKKSCPKHPTGCSSKISPASDPSHKHCATAEESLTCVDMSLKDSEENSVYFAQHQREEPDPIVYAQVKVQTKISLPTDGSGDVH